MVLDPRRVALRLGFQPLLIGRLQSRGHLSTLALTDEEIRRRLYHAHRAFLKEKGERVMAISISPEHRARPNPVVVALAALAIGAGATAGAYQAFGSGEVARPATPSAPAHSTPPAKVKVTSIGGDNCLATLRPQPC